MEEEEVNVALLAAAYPWWVGRGQRSVSMAIVKGGKKEEELPAGAFVVPQTQKDPYRPILRAASRPAALFSVKGCGCVDSASAGFIGRRLLGSEMPGAVQTGWKDQPVWGVLCFLNPSVLTQSIPSPQHPSQLHDLKYAVQARHGSPLTQSCSPALQTNLPAWTLDPRAVPSPLSLLVPYTFSFNARIVGNAPELNTCCCLTSWTRRCRSPGMRAASPCGTAGAEGRQLSAGTGHPAS